MRLTKHGKKSPELVATKNIRLNACSSFRLQRVVFDPAKSKGPVERQVARIITPGTVTDEALLNERQDNLLCAIHPFDN